MGVKHEAPKGHLRDMRFLLCLGTTLPVYSRDGHLEAAIRNTYSVEAYRLEMAAHRTSSTASRRRRGSAKARSPKPSAAPRKRSASSKAKTAAS